LSEKKIEKAAEPGDKQQTVPEGDTSAVFLMTLLSIGRIFRIFDPRLSTDQKYTNHAALRAARSPLFHHAYSFVIILLVRRHKIILHGKMFPLMPDAKKKARIEN